MRLGLRWRFQYGDLHLRLGQCMGGFGWRGCHWWPHRRHFKTGICVLMPIY